LKPPIIHDRLIRLSLHILAGEHVTCLPGLHMTPTSRK